MVAIHIALLLTLLALGASAAPEGEGRIVGGVEASRGDFPWMVRIETAYKNEDGDTRVVRCGGWYYYPQGGGSCDSLFLGLTPRSLILPSLPLRPGTLVAPQVVLTAASCVDMQNIIQIGAGVGRYNDTEKGSTDLNALFLPTKIVIHPDYSAATGINDVAVLILNRARAIYSNLPQPIAVNRNAWVPRANATLRVMGWGRLETGSDVTVDAIRQVDLTYYTPSLCAELNAKWLAETGSDYLMSSPAIMCAGASAKGVCNGDSGGEFGIFETLRVRPLTDGLFSGPLVLRTGSKWTQVGIVSFGPIPCADSENPAAIYTRLSAPSIRSFIQKHIQENKPAVFGNFVFKLGRRSMRCPEGAPCSMRVGAGTSWVPSTYYARPDTQGFRLLNCPSIDGKANACVGFDADGQTLARASSCDSAPTFSIAVAQGRRKYFLKSGTDCVNVARNGELVLGRCAPSSARFTLARKKTC